MSGAPPTDGYSSQATDPLSSVKITEGGLRQWWLHWVYPEPGLTHLDRSELSVGREPTCDVVLSDAKVSRRHATIRLAPHSPPQIRDLGSSNGTAIDGKRCETEWLRDGCVLRVGQSVAVIVHAEGQGELTQELSADAKWPYLGSEKLKATLEKADRIATLPGAVFIQAETGTGKEYLARRVHAKSGRSGDFVAVNCAGVRGELAAAQLFGHVKGAFTSANNSTPGALRRADKGTVFLDEVAELPLESQALLLRATQAQEVTPVGSSIPVHSNFRVICASHTSLIELVGRQAFRADLYYRLTSHQLSLPPLQQRKEDIVALFERASGIPTKRLQTRLVEQLLLHEWPGNVRELENAAIAVQALPGEPETWAQLPFLPAVATGGEPATVEQHAFTKPPSEDNPIPSTRQMSPRQWQELYAKHHGNAAEVARATGLKVSTVKRHFAAFRSRGS